MVTVIDRGTLALGGEATVHFAEQLRDELAAALAGLEGPLTIRTGGLEALDLVGAQLLLSLRVSRGADRVAFSGWPGPIADFLATSGLEPLFT